uniref:Uncharacterized protein n=1 Tax=Molossus molossus TaxID=27622 RepID=A0A7J8E3D8_MOLMO|nr:hypothetical protein HJG59_009081 [Molossus molossus]
MPIPSSRSLPPRAAGRPGSLCTGSLPWVTSVLSVQPPSEGPGRLLSSRAPGRTSAPGALHLPVTPAPGSLAAASPWSREWLFTTCQVSGPLSGPFCLMSVRHLTLSSWEPSAALLPCLPTLRHSSPMSAVSSAGLAPSLVLPQTGGPEVNDTRADSEASALSPCSHVGSELCKRWAPLPWPCGQCLGNSLCLLFILHTPSRDRLSRFQEPNPSLCP